MCRGTNNMKRIIITIILGFLISIIFLIYLQWGRDIEICNTRPETSSNAYFENVTLIANKLYIHDKYEFAESVIQKCVDNSRKEVIFSYDIVGYPNKLCIDVYMNNYAFDHRQNASFRITYSQDSKFNYKYNIKDNPEKFTITIE